MNRRATFISALLLLAVGALLFRLPSLDNRPMHSDEAVHTLKFDEIWEKGGYRYDPNEFHGPTLYYAALPSVWLRGRQGFADTTASDYRIVIVVFGASMVLLLLLFADGLGKQAALWAALFTAISPALVFYSRYYIQETLLAFFTLALLGCLWRYSKTRQPAWAAAGGLSAGLMLATKETAVLSFGALVIAFAATAFLRRKTDAAANLRALWNPRHAAMAACVALVAACVVLSGFFTDLSAPVDYLRSFTPWANRAQGTEMHRHPWLYYLGILAWTQREHGPVWSEGLIVGLAIVGMVAAFVPARGRLLEGSVGLAQFLSVYTIVLTAVYSVIPYKTPWCVLTFLSSMILLAGVGAATLLRLARPVPVKILVGVILLAASGQLAWQSYRTSFVFFADNHNPYVYAPTLPEVETIMARRMDALAQAYSKHNQMVVMVIATDGYYWPLPWYLRKFPNVGYYTKIPAKLSPDVVLATSDLDDDLTTKLNDTHIMTGYFGVRPGATYEMWVRINVWSTYIATRKAIHKPTAEGE